MNKQKQPTKQQKSTPKSNTTTRRTQRTNNNQQQRKQISPRKNEDIEQILNQSKEEDEINNFVFYSNSSEKKQQRPQQPIVFSDIDVEEELNSENLGSATGNDKVEVIDNDDYSIHSDLLLNEDNTESNNDDHDHAADNLNELEIGSGPDSIKIDFNLNDDLDDEEDNVEDMSDFINKFGTGKLPSDDDDDEIDTNIDFSHILKNYS